MMYPKQLCDLFSPFMKVGDGKIERAGGDKIRIDICMQLNINLVESETDEHYPSVNLREDGLMLLIQHMLVLD